MRTELRNRGTYSVSQRNSTLIFWLLAGTAFAQPPGDCVVNILNRTGVVGTDGRWRVENVPSLQGPVRARFTCTSNGVTQYGQTPFFEIRTNQTTAFPAGITLGNFQVPSSLSITAPVTTLNGPGTSTQASVVVTFHDGVTRDVTTAASFTSYFSSNSQLATVSPNGLITATGVGSVIVTTVYDGVSSFLALEITRGGDSENDGIADSAEVLLGLLPNNPVDALEDPDGDGLTNLDEYRLNSDLRNPDTDGDGIPDGKKGHADKSRLQPPRELTADQHLIDKRAIRRAARRFASFGTHF